MANAVTLIFWLDNSSDEGGGVGGDFVIGGLKPSKNYDYLRLAV